MSVGKFAVCNTVLGFALIPMSFSRLKLFKNKCNVAPLNYTIAKDWIPLQPSSVTLH